MYYIPQKLGGPCPAHARTLHTSNATDDRGDGCAPSSPPAHRFPFPFSVQRVGEHRPCRELRLQSIGVFVLAKGTLIRTYKDQYVRIRMPFAADKITDELAQVMVCSPSVGM